MVNKYKGIYLTEDSMLHAVDAYYVVYLVVFEQLLILHFSKTIHFIVLLRVLECKAVLKKTNNKEGFLE